MNDTRVRLGISIKAFCDLINQQRKRFNKSPLACDVILTRCKLLCSGAKVNMVQEGDTFFLEEEQAGRLADIISSQFDIMLSRSRLVRSCFNEEAGK